MNGLRPSGIARAEEHGQSLVEVALMLPVLLLIVLGLVDITRLYSFKTAATNAAREAAIYAARDPQVTANQVCQRARNELGAGIAAAPCAAPDVAVDCSRVSREPVPPVPCGNDASIPAPLFQTVGVSGGDVTVTVTYRINLISGYLVTRIFDVNPVAVSGTAFFPGLGE
jgi:Flp pilus assembly protein TadG